MECLSSDSIDTIIITAMIVSSLATMLVGKILQTKDKHWRGDPKYWNSNDE